MILTTLKKGFINLYYINTRQKKTNYFVLNIPLKHYCICVLCLFMLFCINLAYKYTIFLELQQGRSFEATILNHYSKKENSESFKFQDSNGNVFYATYKGKFKNIVGKHAQVYGKIYRCSFLRFLKSCNIYHSSFSLLPKDEIRRNFVHFINNQHESGLSANLYNALFFASNLAYPLRQSATALGLAHLIAISGFHLASLTCMFYIFICPLYFLFHRYFCYRNALYDLALLGLLFGFCYLTLINFEPSFLRAFLMACVGYIIVYSGLQILSFMNLLLCVLFAYANNPSLIFHVGLSLSICGVFCIFLFLQHIGKHLRSSSKIKKIVIGIVLFDCIIFLQMMPIVHFYFPYFSPYQLVSIPLSIVFFLLFPCLIILHIFQYGAVFDSIIEDIVAHDFFMSQIYTPLWLLIIYLILLILAIRYRLAYFLSLVFAFLFYCWNLIHYLSIG